MRTPELDHPYTPSRDAKPPRTIKVWIGLSVEVDVDALEAEYGRTFTAAEARQDVKDSIPNVLYQAIYPESANIITSVKETK
jgi:hypothetical protein